MTPVLQARGLRLRFGGVVAADGIDLDLAPGARHALIGPNGAGKTTLLHLLGGQLRPQAGRVLLDGRDVTALPPHRRAAAGLVRSFQIGAGFRSLVPREALALAAAQAAGQSGTWWRPLARHAQAGRTADALLERFGLAAVAAVPVRHLAYGQRRLLELALALACAPRVLLLDEPAAGIPAEERGSLAAALTDLPAAVAVLLVEHDMDLVFRFAEQVTVLAEGRVLAQGTPAAIAADPRVQTAYLGTPLASD
ncbi:ATP-binding cassette domain-containing protein [uncultured Xylophilus sp.]|uniref:ABC transporter ATP-binding protein n=1 Tax=uncultured Xylophilus sp. TaxID=296832 RepID=UPI0025E658E8|nr:ATP-binding cassette domain-containing protein [uncultured Xylophilus sp.]